MFLLLVKLYPIFDYRINASHVLIDFLANLNFFPLSSDTWCQDAVQQKMIFISFADGSRRAGQGKSYWPSCDAQVSDDCSIVLKLKVLALPWICQNTWISRPKLEV
uniref:Alkyldihydroxyacetonephosphate synthase n=1 Tax=Anthurium amnicola TaxID=1678845 RepID=A0A1D1YKK4_9ARAE